MWIYRNNNVALTQLSGYKYHHSIGKKQWAHRTYRPQYDYLTDFLSTPEKP
jgi:hypothetical protein